MPSKMIILSFTGFAEVGAGNLSLNKRVAQWARKWILLEIVSRKAVFS
jgi:hypothetical protein